MKKGKVRDHAIKAGVGKRKILRVTLPKLDLRKHFFRDRDHFGGKIETDRNCGALGRGGGDITGTATDIEDRHLPGHFRGVEQWRNELSGRARPNRIILVGDALPTFMFQFGESVAHFLKYEG